MKQRALEIKVAILFSLIIVLLAGTGVGFVPLNETRFVDLSIVPAMFASMIGGYVIGIPIAITWTVVHALSQTDFDGVFIFVSLIINISYVVSLVWSYNWFKKKFKGDPLNVYYALTISVFVRHIVLNVLYVVVLKEVVKLPEWLYVDLIELVIELAICTLSMKMIVGHLRQFHILNGIKKTKK